MHKTTRWIPLYLAIVLFSLTTFRQMPSLMRYSSQGGAELVHILTNPLSYSHNAPEVISQIGLAKNTNKNNRHTSISASSTSQSSFHLYDHSHGLWQNEYNVVHVVHTRFMQHQASLQHLAAGRLQLFHTFTLPSMMQQTTKQFLWIIWIDPQLDGPVLDRLLSLVARVPNALLVAANDHGTRTTADLRSLYNIPPSDVKTFVREGSAQLLLDYHAAAQNRLLVESRVDADDAVHQKFVESVQQHAAKGVGQETENEHAIQVLCPEHHVEWHYYKRDDEDNPHGHLTHYHNQQICINSGLSVAYHIHATHKQLEFMDSNQYNNVQQKIPICGDDAQELIGTSSTSSLRGGAKAQDQEAKMASRHTKMIQDLFQQHQQEAQAALDDEQREELAEKQKEEATALSQQIDAEKMELQQRLQKRHPHYAHARDSNECWTTLEMLGDEALHINSFQAAIILARTPLAAGMNNVLPKKFTSRHSVELPTYKSPSDQARAWELMAQDFHLFQLAVQQTRATLESDMRNIVMDALAGQCTTGHSCKPASKKALLSIVYMIELKEKDSGVLDEVDEDDEEQTQPETIMDKLITLFGLRRPDPEIIDDETAAVIDLLPADAPEYDLEKIMGNHTLEKQNNGTHSQLPSLEPRLADKSSTEANDVDSQTMEGQGLSKESLSQPAVSEGLPIQVSVPPPINSTFTDVHADKGHEAALELVENLVADDTQNDKQGNDFSKKSKETSKDTPPAEEPSKGDSSSDNAANDTSTEEEASTTAAPEGQSQLPPLYTRLWNQVFGRNDGKTIKTSLRVNETLEEGFNKSLKGEQKTPKVTSMKDEAKSSTSNSNKKPSETAKSNQSLKVTEKSDLKENKKAPRPSPNKKVDSSASSGQKKSATIPKKKAPATTKTNQAQKPATKPKPKPKKKTKVLYEGVEREYMIPKHVENIRDIADTHYEVELYVKPDENPEHASFVLYDLRAERVVAERKHLSRKEKIYVVPIPTGHYSFEFQDSEGDGFKGETTRFELWVNKKKLVEGSDFGSSSGKREFKLYTNGLQKLVDQSQEQKK